jgi:hypothetical protein
MIIIFYIFAVDCQSENWSLDASAEEFVGKFCEKQISEIAKK